MSVATHAAHMEQVPLSGRQDEVQRFAAMGPQLYRLVKLHLQATDADTQRLIDWTLKGTKPPATPEILAGEITWIILCAGRTAQSARTIERRVLAAIHARKPVLSVYGHRARAAAIERAWAERDSDFAALHALLQANDVRRLIEWCGTLPGVGLVTRFQLAKNFGAQVVKPDIWMCRYAGIRDRERISASARFDRCQAMAEAICDATRDSVPLVDSMLWQAGNKGVLHVEFDPYAVIFRPGAPRRRTIY